MSYCRFGSNESDVYMYASVNGGIVCCVCSLSKSGGDSQKLPTFDAAIGHLKKHIKAGDTVPQHAINRLLRDKKEGVSLQPITRS